MNEGGDFTADKRLIFISAIAVCVGALCAFVAVGLTCLISFFTNVFYFGRLSLESHSPAENSFGWLAALIPALGGLIIGLMARYGSDRIRGHGIPEALEAILIGRSRMSPKVAALKPLSSAISIGTGGPFGAEGPIIMTGGAFGSIIAQAFHMTAVERKTLLVAGAAGGMSATFATPVAAVLLAIELLLFELKPRSMIPVALASAVAALLRPYLAGPGPIFPVTPHARLELAALVSAAAVGLFAGMLSLLLTRAVYLMEDLFQKLKFHWMWWPVIGGLVVGIGGLIQPHALGVGYDNIERLLTGEYVPRALITLFLVKGVIWAVSLGSGTSGGVLAPLLIMGGTLGAFESTFLPGGDKTLWPLVSMAAVLGGTMRSPLTGLVFALELTHDIEAMPALLIAAVIAHAFTVLVMKRSILTEKVARRGYHISREYSIDPLERLSVGEVMSNSVVTVPASAPVKELIQKYFFGAKKHQSYPVIDKSNQIVGVITRSNLLKRWMESLVRGEEVSELNSFIAFDLIDREPITIFPWEPCRVAAERMAQSGVGRLAVVSPENPGTVVGIITRSDLLKPRRHFSDEEVQRERFFGLPSATLKTETR